MTDPWTAEWQPPAPAWGQPWDQPGPGWVPPDPWEVADATRRRALRYGIASVVLLPLAVATFYVGLLTLLLGIGFLILPVAVLMVPMAGGLALTSVVQLARTPFPGKSRVLPMLPALVTLLAIGSYAVAVAVNAATESDAPRTPTPPKRSHVSVFVHPPCSAADTCDRERGA